MKKFTALILFAAVALSLCGCGSIFDKEYVAVYDYTPPTAEPGDDDKINVSDFEGLKQAILELVSAGQSEGTIRFDPGYKGESIEDMASACWQIRSQNALCAYCVDNIAYELKKIVNYTEADVYISYASGGRKAEDVVKLEFSTDIKDHIKEAYSEGKTKLAVLVERSPYSSEAMVILAEKVYREDPGCAPVNPKVTVNLFSGNGYQRLYEFNINYAMSNEDFKNRKALITKLDPFSGSDVESMSEGERAYLACTYLAEHSSYDKNNRQSSIYSALISGSADSEGLAFAYVELCRRLGLESIAVYGQYEWEDYCWNIVKIDGEYYHVDTANCVSKGLEGCFMLSDESMWADHRWDLSSYPQCKGSLRYEDVKK